MADPVPGEKWTRNSDSVEFLVVKVEGDHVLLVHFGLGFRPPVSKTGFDQSYTKVP